MERTGSLEGAILYAHLEDDGAASGHIDCPKMRRGRGDRIRPAVKVVLDADWPHTLSGRDAFANLDAWLRAEGRKRNPGTTADLIAACLFVLLHERKIIPLQQFRGDSPSPMHKSG